MGISAAYAAEAGKMEKDEHKMPPPYVGSAELQKVKSLAGKWEGPSPDMPGGKINLDYKVTSNGSVVVETIMPGTPMEMISIYRDNKEGKLTMTHYCAMGNQPHMKLDPRASKDDTLVFAFDGGTNFDPKKDGHIHQGNIRFVGENRLDGAWSYWMNGREAGKKVFSLTRKAR